MKRRETIPSKKDETPRSSLREDLNSRASSRSELERLKRRLEWKRQQELEREHERRKEKMILEYELKRQEALRRRRSSHTRSKSRSKSAEGSRSISQQQKSRTIVMSEKLDKSSGSVPLFKGSEGEKISLTELRSIKVDIHRNIEKGNSTRDIHRDIVDPEEIMLKRRKGEGSKPLFEREELKKRTTETEEVEERRTVSTIDKEEKSKYRRRSASLSPPRKRNYSPQASTSRHSRLDDSKVRTERSHYHSGDRKDRDSSRDKRQHKRDYRDVSRENRASLHSTDKDYDHKRRYSRSKEREYRKGDITSHTSSREERSSLDYGDRSRDHSRDRRDQDRTRVEHRVPPAHYYEPVPVPIFYGEFPARPMLYRPMVPIRGQIPVGRGRAPFMSPLRHFSPRYMPPDMFRLAPPNPRYGPPF